MSYAARYNLHDDEVVVYGPADRLEDLLDEVCDGESERLNGLLDDRGSRLYALAEACAQAGSEAELVLAVVAAARTHYFNARPTLLLGPWEVTRT
jgi:hypothetical protein